MHNNPLFRAGNVQKIQGRVDPDHHHYRCICLPEMKEGIVYNINLSIDKTTTDIDFASCECPAGKGPMEAVSTLQPFHMHWRTTQD